MLISAGNHWFSFFFWNVWGNQSTRNVFSLHDGKHFQENALSYHTYESSQFLREALFSLDISMSQAIVLAFRWLPVMVKTLYICSLLLPLCFQWIGYILCPTSGKEAWYASSFAIWPWDLQENLQLPSSN